MNGARANSPEAAAGGMRIPSGVRSRKRNPRTPESLAALRAERAARKEKRRKAAAAKREGGKS